MMEGMSAFKPHTQPIKPRSSPESKGWPVGSAGQAVKWPTGQGQTGTKPDNTLDNMQFIFRKILCNFILPNKNFLFAICNLFL